MDITTVVRRLFSVSPKEIFATCPDAEIVIQYKGWRAATCSSRRISVRKWYEISLVCTTLDGLIKHQKATHHSANIFTLIRVCSMCPLVDRVMERRTFDLEGILKRELVLSSLCSTDDSSLFDFGEATQSKRLGLRFASAQGSDRLTSDGT